jgi:hypothetical protein
MRKARRGNKNVHANACGELPQLTPQGQAHMPKGELY